MSGDILSNRRKPSIGPSVAAPTHELTIGGVTPFTTIDFPGRLAAVLYTQGCQWRCRYCHNSHLWPFHADSAIPFSKVLHFLENRKGLLEGVVFCGGEPTAHADLPEAIHMVKEMGFQMALHTTGMYPERLEEILPLCDWVGFDVKAPFDEYEKITRVSGSGTRARESVRRLLKSGVDHEIRTTFHPALLSEEQILEMARELNAMGIRQYVIQAFQPKGCLEKELQNIPLSEEIISDGLKSSLSRLFQDFRVRT